MSDETDDGDETLAELFTDVSDLAGQVAHVEEIERRWNEWLQRCATPPPAPAVDRIQILMDVDLSNADISTTLTVRPQVPLMQVSELLRLLAEAIETGQINSLQLPRDRS